MRTNISKDKPIKISDMAHKQSFSDFLKECKGAPDEFLFQDTTKKREQKEGNKTMNDTMPKLRIKCFSDDNTAELENKVNNFLDQNQSNTILDIQYCTSSNRYGTVYSVMIKFTT